ncbi:T9SS type A sorting domain-containing protein [Saccharicrinis sp. FJH54]|uniref:T9SS type A sorting domain-containing protein n=1 Tax=Saccharicrinis sp. FJH54 TaxID=3344665 RepID=UPI0035D450E0
MGRLLKRKITCSLFILNLFFVGSFGNLMAASENSTGDNHFVTVWDGENGFGHMNIYIVTATLDKLPLQAGDEIAVFSHDVCVGATTLTTASNNDLINLVASLDDGTGNGFVNGDSILFRVWDSSDQAEKFVTRINYRQDVSTWLTDGHYGFNESSFVDLVIQSDFYQNIELSSGWNLFSGYVLDENPDMKHVLDSLINEGDLIKVQDESGKTLEDLGALGGWKNNIGNMKSTEGYKIKVLNDCNLALRGLPVTVPVDINLHEGWNIISFPVNYQVDAKDVFQSLIDNGSLEKVKDERGNSLEDWGIYGGWVNNIGNCRPGEGYEVHVSGDVTLTISTQFNKSQEIYSLSADPTYFATVYEGNGLDHMNINILALDASELQINDEIAVYDGEYCVGAVKITEDHISKNAAVINAASAFAEDPGFEEGDYITYKIYKAGEKVVRSVNPIYLKGSDKFVKLESSFVKLNIVLNDKPEDLAFGVSAFPNPTSGIFTVNIKAAQNENCMVDIYDVTGKIIEHRNLDYTAESFDLTGRPQGVYLVKTTVGDSVKVNKINLQY